jgi:CheY-like chemotaxis protein
MNDGKPLIVIADDDASDRFLIKTAFEEAGMDLQIDECEDGAELIEYAKNACNGKMPRFILLDLNMPKKTGIEVLEFFRENPTICPVPVIILSTSSEQRDISKATELGAAQYIVKPYDYTGYIDVVNQLNIYVQ